MSLLFSKLQGILDLDCDAKQVFYSFCNWKEERILCPVLCKCQRSRARALARLWNLRCEAENVMLEEQNQPQDKVDLNCQSHTQKPRQTPGSNAESLAQAAAKRRSRS